MSNLFAQIAAQQKVAAAAAGSVSYVPASKRDEIRAQITLKVYAICHPITATSGSDKTNHWTLSFDVGNGQGVTLDIQPDHQDLYPNGGFKAQVIVSKLDHIITEEAVRHVPISVTYQRSVGWYLDYFSAGGRFKYAFTGEGVGCRYWITDTLKLLVEIGEANKIDFESARCAIAQSWPSNRPSEPEAGTFF